jgi:D-glycero-D-manno-heptose 1,7-bisphosphate phosphatase
MSGRKAVFFDRDGTLMEEAFYCGDPAKVRMYAGVPEALDRLKQAGFLNIIISNQSGIGRGLITEAQYRAVEAELLRQIGENRIDASYYCAETPEAGSHRRKPEPGMVLEAAAAFGIDLRESYFIGDKCSDVECGRRAGTKAILVRTGYGAEQTCTADFTAQDVAIAAEIIAGQVRAFPRSRGDRPK